MTENITPEERLLNLIKGKGSNAKKEPPAPSSSEKSAQENMIPAIDKNKPESPARQDNVPVQEKKPIQEKKAKKYKKRSISPAGIAQKSKGLRSSLSVYNKILVILFAAVIVYAIISHTIPYRSGEEIPQQISSTEISGISEATMRALQPLNYYTGALGNRQMFKLYELPRRKEAGPQKPKVTLQQLLSGYTFVGIIFGDSPQAIIEEKRSRQSYYLSEGQTIGEIKIEKIDKGKVTVSYEEESMDIRI